MVFTPYTIDTGSSATTYTVPGLNPGKQYNFSVTAKNGIGTGSSSNTVSATMAAQAASTTPSIAQRAAFRSDNPAPASITLSLPSVPNANNTILILFNGYAGTGSNSNAITAPSGAQVLSGPNYDGGSEVTWAWKISTNVNSNSFTFTNFDNTDNAGWQIFEIANWVNQDVNHGAVSGATTTNISWPLVTPSSTNCIRITQLSIQFAATIGSPASGLTVLTSDSPTVSFHQAVTLSELAGTTSGSLTITGGTAADTDSYLSLNIYGSTLPSQVTGLASSNITSTGVKLSWNAVPNITSYTVMYEGGGISTFTQLSVVPSTSTTLTVTGLIQSTTYVFNVFASNASGQGTASTNLTVATLATQALSQIQTAFASSTNAGTSTSTLTATFGSSTTVGNTLAFFFTAFASTNNLLLAPPSNASNSTGILRDDGSSSDPISMFWTQPVVAAATSYSFGPIDDAGSLIVVEIQGVTSLDAPLHGGSLVYVDGASGHVNLPVTHPSTTPAFGLYHLHMTNTVDSWGTPPTNMTLLKGITSGGVASYHQGALFQATSAVATGTQTIPYSLGNSITQLAAPTYIGVNFYGTSGGTYPGQPVVTAGTTTSSTQVLSWTTPSNAQTYTVQYRVNGQTAWNTFQSGISSTSTTVTGLTASTSYDYQVIAYNGLNAGPSSVVVTQTTLASTPSQVTGVTLGTATTTTQGISWSAATGTVTSYTVQYKLATASSFTSITGLTGLSTTVSGLTPSSSYIYQVLALNGQSAGTPSATVTGSTAALTPPGQPSGVTLGTTTDVTQQISWTASTGTVTSYSVLYSSTSSTGPWTTLPNIASTSTTVSNLTPSTVYYYEVIAYNGPSSPSAASAVVNRSTSTAVPPGPVTGLTIGTTTSTSQVLSWTAATGTVTSYTLQYKVSGASAFTSVTAITGTNYTLTGLAPATSYIYQVFASNGQTAGSASSTATSTTLTASGTSGSRLVTINGKLLVVGGKFIIA